MTPQQKELMDLNKNLEHLRKKLDDTKRFYSEHIKNAKSEYHESIQRKTVVLAAFQYLVVAAVTSCLCKAIRLEETTGDTRVREAMWLIESWAWSTFKTTTKKVEDERYNEQKSRGARINREVDYGGFAI